MSIEIKNIYKSFQSFKALDGINLDIKSGELVALLGPSGCGKTTLLRIIAGLEVQDSGEILFSGEDLSDRSIGERKVGFVFQHYALFKHMTVFENIAFGLKVMKKSIRPSKEIIQKKVDELLSLVRLESLRDRYPSQLSGGQRQRIALARALAVEPKVLLLDEPFGALDAQVRKELRRWLRKLHDEIHVTSVFVTHDQEEALEVADRVVVMNKGRLEQYGTPEEVYNKPSTPFVYNFLGNVNLFHGRMENGKLLLAKNQPQNSETETNSGRTANVYIRPHHFHVSLEKEDETFTRGTVSHTNPLGAHMRLEVLDDHNNSILIEISTEKYGELTLKKGSTIYFKPREQTIFWDGEYEDFSI